MHGLRPVRRARFVRAFSCPEPAVPTAPRRYRPPGGGTAAGYDRARGTAAQRGYDAAWRRCRAAHIAAEPLCRACASRGRVTIGEHVDHIRPITGRDDPARLDPDNLQTLCVACHNVKTARDGSRRG